MTEREKVYQKYNGHCAYCGREITIKEMQVDHYYPVSACAIGKAKGINTEDFENKMPSCSRCNHYKRALQPATFKLMMKTLHERIAKIYINKVAIDYGIIKITPFTGQFYFEYVYEQEQKYSQKDFQIKS